MRRLAVESRKDNVLAMIIHGIVTQELGWEPKRVHIGGDVHELAYQRPGSPLRELVIKLTRRGDRLVMEFEGGPRLSPLEEFVDELVKQLLGIELDEVKRRMVLELDHYVDDDLRPRNVEELRQLLARVIGVLEEAARRARG